MSATWEERKSAARIRNQRRYRAKLTEQVIGSNERPKWLFALFLAFCGCTFSTAILWGLSTVFGVAR